MGDFKIIEKIGFGPFGRVYRAIQNRNHEQVCIKFLDLDQVLNFEEKHLHELDTWTELNHENIVSYQGYFVHDGQLGLVTEIFDNGDLKSFIASQKRPLDENFILRVLFQLVAALRYLHRMKIIHRNIKPSNIFITQDSNIKLGDLMLSCIMDSALQNPFPIDVCFPEMSPEMLNNKTYSFSTDIWSLGCVLYQLMTFKTPFGKDPSTLLQNIDQGFEPIVRKYSDKLKTLVKMMLVKDPDFRISFKKIIQLNIDIPKQPTMDFGVQAHFGTSREKKIERKHHRHHHSKIN